MLNFHRAAGAIALAAVMLAPFSLAAQQPQRLSAFIDQTIALHPSIRAAERGLEKARALARAAGQYPYNPEIECPVPQHRQGGKTFRQKKIFIFESFIEHSLTFLAFRRNRIRNRNQTFNWDC